MDRKVLICLIVFLAVYFAWCAILICAVAKSKPKKEKKQQFDERQIAAQGTAYQWAFWTMCVYYFLYAVVSGAAEIVWCDQYLGMLLGVLVGVTVFALFCLFRDAYFRPDQSKASAIAVINIICLSQGMIGLTHLSEGTLIENGVLSGDCVQFFFVLMAIILDIGFFIKSRMEKREAQE